MSSSRSELLVFEEQYFERIWGGQNLGAVFGKGIPPDRPIGEAWLISDHSTAESVVAEGAERGKTLHQLVQEDAGRVLGRHASLTVHGRFPLLLKLLDANDVLSVQVHPDDDTARRLNEPDVGKTEMWHVLEAAPGSELVCGLERNVTAEKLAAAIEENTLDELLVRFAVEPGDSVFVAAGSVHAIGGGNLLAEIQQNSDLTYRLYDWGRLQADGTSRALHVDKALASIHFGSPHSGKATVLSYTDGDVRRTMLAGCRYFAAELIELDGSAFNRETRCASFHILLSKSGRPVVRTGKAARSVDPGQAILVPGAATHFAVEGRGAVLDYFVPELRADIVEPLLEHGHSEEDIARLGGDPARSDLAL